jgi:hypothetical protein
LANDGVIYEFDGNFYVNDGGVGRLDPTEENLEKLRQLEESYPGIIKIKPNTTVFSYRASRFMVEFPKDYNVVEAEYNAEYQVVQENQESVSEKLPDTIAELEKIKKEEQLTLDPETYTVY